MATTISVEWTADGLLRIEVSAVVAQDLSDCVRDGSRSPELNVLAAMLEDRLDKPRRGDAKAEVDPQSPAG